MSDGDEALFQLCEDACSGRAAEAAALAGDQPELASRSVHAAAVLAADEALGALLAGNPALAVAPLRGPWTPLLLLAFSHCARENAEQRAASARCARLLLDHGARADDFLEDDELPSGRLSVLAAAAAAGNLTLCEALLDAGAAAVDGAALFVAAAKERWDCTDLLRRNGADWNTVDATGRFAPLHWLLDVRFASAPVERVLAEGADPNLRVGVREETALHVAVRRRRVEIVDALLAAGADIDACTAEGLTAYRHALRRQFIDVTDKLATCGADTRVTRSDDLAVALQTGNLDGARAILDAAPELARGWGPEEARLLPDLAAWGRREATELLLDAGHDVDARGLDEGTALHQTGWFGQPEVAELLIARGAALDVRGDAHDSTPLGWVAHGSRYSGGAAARSDLYVRLAELLLAAGAPLPGPDEGHDRSQFRAASDAVKDVLRGHGWAP